MRARSIVMYYIDHSVMHNRNDGPCLSAKERQAPPLCSRVPAWCPRKCLRLLFIFLYCQHLSHRIISPGRTSSSSYYNPHNIHLAARLLFSSYMYFFCVKLTYKSISPNKKLTKIIEQKTRNRMEEVVCYWRHGQKFPSMTSWSALLFHDIMASNSLPWRH